MTMEQCINLITQQGIAFYDSSKGEAPFYTNPDDTIKMYDIKEEASMAELERILTEDDIKYKEVEVPNLSINNNNNNVYINNDGTSISFSNHTGQISGIDTINSSNHFHLDVNTGPLRTEAEGNASLRTTHLELQDLFEGEVTEENFDQVANPYGVLTQEVLEETLEEVFSANSSNLTSDEVNQLEVNDPRGGDGLSDEEHALIESRMEGVTSRRVNGGFNLIDDTNE
jgi:hypothetical protein